jgi:hypothetical protein
MGSLKSDGTFIEQKRSSIRQLGGSYTESADRIESRTVLTGNQPQFSVDNADEDSVQTSATKLDDCIKVTNSKTDTTVNRVCRTGIDL